MANRYLKSIAGVIAGVTIGAVITLAFGANAVGVIVGAIFGVSLCPVTEWREALTYGGVIGGFIGGANGLISAYDGGRLTHVMVSASMGALIGAVWGGAVGRVFRSDQEQFPGQ